MQYRINKFLSINNVCSRRKANDLVFAKKVYINGHLASPGEYVNSEKDSVVVGGKKIDKNNQQLEYYFLNKPKNILSSASDDRGRKTVADLVPSKFGNKLVPVGRLDYNSTGLILLTNDGDLTYVLTHPKFHIPKKYVVKTKEKLDPKKLDIIKAGGLKILDKITSKTDIKIIDQHSFEITLYEGIKRQIRESCKLVGLTVLELQRIKIGEFELGSLPEGKYRELDIKEHSIVEKIKSKNINIIVEQQ